jgi:Arc/MetJ-type ribon-helix-helix transcriptional regulator
MYIMNVNLGAPYEAAIKAIIEKGYAGTQTEAIRQAILAYERMIKEEEQTLVHKAVEIEMMELDACKVKIHSFQEIKKSLGSGR